MIKTRSLSFLYECYARIYLLMVKFSSIKDYYLTRVKAIICYVCGKYVVSKYNVMNFLIIISEMLIMCHKKDLFLVI